MRTNSLRFLGLALMVTATLAFSVSASGQNRKPGPAPERTLIGYISDAACGLHHMGGMSDKDCTLMCARNGKFVLADRDQKLIYQLDQAGQEKAPEFAGQKVKIKGRVTGKTIRVTAIEAAA